MSDEDDDLDSEPGYDPDFAKRMKIACDNLGLPPGKGRPAWIKRELGNRGVKASLNSIYRWYEGLQRPRSRKILVLAEVLKVDRAWLALGTVPELDIQKKRHFDSSADASVNIVMGFVQLAGWQCAFPEEDDPNKSFAHFYSIIKGKQHRFHVCYGLENEDGSVTFAAPPSHEKCVVVGLIEKKPLQVELVQIPSSVIEAAGPARVGTIKVTTTKSGSTWLSGTQRLQVITSFSKSLVE